MFLLTIYERAKGERAKKGGRREEGLCKFIPMYMDGKTCASTYVYGVEWSVKGLVFLLRFLLTIYGDFVFRPGRPPCRLVCKPSCKFTLSGYGISYRRRRRGDRGALA